MFRTLNTEPLWKRRCALASCFCGWRVAREAGSAVAGGHHQNWAHNQNNMNCMLCLVKAPGVPKSCQAGLAHLWPRWHWWLRGGGWGCLWLCSVSCLGEGCGQWLLHQPPGRSLYPAGQTMVHCWPGTVARSDLLAQRPGEQHRSIFLFVINLQAVPRVSTCISLRNYCNVDELDL
eukprot:scaffold98641_cov16-Tisochrysis_lutea.AAC.2